MASGQYKEESKTTKTQAELITEMTQELSSLPRFTAYVKVLQVSGQMGEIQLVQKEKIKTIEPPGKKDWTMPPEFPTGVLRWSPELTISFHSYHKCQLRDAIENQIKKRQEDWKPKTQEAEKPFPSKKPHKISKPPPTSYTKE